MVSPTPAMFACATSMFLSIFFNTLCVPRSLPLERVAEIYARTCPQ